MSNRSLTREKSDKSLTKTGYSSPNMEQRKIARGLSASSLKDEDEGGSSTPPGMARQGSDRTMGSNGSSTSKLMRGSSERNFNEDGTSNREFNRDGSLRSAGKANSLRLDKQDSDPSLNSPSKSKVIAASDLDAMIKQVSSRDLVSSGEIDDFIADIENNLSKEETKSSHAIARQNSAARKTIKNSASRDSILDGSHDFDRYGFMISKPEEGAFLLSNNDLLKHLDKEDERTDKWIYMLNHWDTFFLRKFNKVKSRVRKGVPHAVRGEAWYRLAHVDDMKTLFPLALDLENLEERLDAQVIDEIGRDVNRTFPTHRLFHEDGPGQGALKRVLQRYAILDPAIGYCQGMGFLAALLLQYLHEHDAFYALVSLMNRPSLPFRGMYSPGMEDTKKVLAVFAILGEAKLPKLWAHMVSEGVHHTMYVTSWIMTVFVSAFHFDFAVRVWDVLWVEGWKVVYKVCIGLLKYGEAELMTCNMEEIMMYFRKMADRMDPEEVWKSIWSVKVTQEEVTRCEQWYLEEGGA